jgi:beta-galactosidase
MSRIIELNNGWEYIDIYEDSFAQNVYKQGSAADINLLRLPHTGTILPFNYTDEGAYQKLSGYRRRFNLPRLAEGTRLFVTFKGAAQEAVVYFNGKLIARHSCGYTAFTVELTDSAITGENLLAVRLDSRESLNQPPFGNVIDYLTYSGLYRGCYLELTSSCFIADTFVTTDAYTVKSELIIAGRGGAAITQYLLDENGLILCENTLLISDSEPGDSAFPTVLPVKKEECVSVALSIKADPGDISFWSITRPALYTMRYELRDFEGGLIDEKQVRFGFRKAEFKKDGFYLNGERLKIRGLNRHQSYPYAGYAMPDSVQRRDADILKYELGLNAIRTSHYPQSQAFVDRCDEIGLLVFTEIPGWQHIGDSAWKEIAVSNTEEMVLQYRNHPSVILWGVRINESQDDDELYTRTNSRAHRLDPTRQTGGVRYIKKSSLLEDVYTYNDFSHTGGNEGLADKKDTSSDQEKPYLVTEFNGHMFPTKSFDCEGHRLEHALRHARVLNAMYGEENIAGCFGWCAFDYNTHKEFGSGDKVCYHGVMDMFRNPKPAAWVYASQNEDRPFLEVASTMDIGEHPAGNIGAIYVFTNADSVRMYKNNELIGDFKPDRKSFPNLPHPPVKIDDYIGQTLEKKEGYSHNKAEKIKACLYAVAKYGQTKLPFKYKMKMASLMLFNGLNMKEGTRLYNTYIGGWGGVSSVWRFEAVKNGQVVASQEKGSVEQVNIILEADKTTLKEDGAWDAACVRLRAEDGRGGRLWYFSEPVILSTEGPIELVGPRLTAFRGGSAGTYVKTTGEKGRARLTVRCAVTDDVAIDFEIV